MAPILSTHGDAAEVLGGRSDVPVVFCCEHASERLPGRWRWSDNDSRLVGTHWAFDLGAADLTRELADRLGAPAVLARFSRLLADPNRPEDSATLFRADAEGLPVELNTDIADTDRAQRIADYYRPYHAALDATVRASLAPILFSVHSFTPEYQGEPRAMELGVLFNYEDALGLALNAHLAAAGYRTLANEPYSGYAGLIHAARRHGRAHGIVYVELEVRQDLIETEAGARDVAMRLAPAIERLARIELD